MWNISFYKVEHVVIVLRLHLYISLCYRVKGEKKVSKLGEILYLQLGQNDADILFIFYSSDIFIPQVVGSTFTQENRRRCADAAIPLMEAVENITSYASLPEFLSVPAQITPQVGKVIGFTMQKMVGPLLEAIKYL